MAIAKGKAVKRSSQRMTERSAGEEGAASNPLWFKDAVIYQLHVRAFYDSDGDGIGDFRGLTEKLDYIKELGVTAIWLLPFFVSPLRDDGYDIADYTQINPAYGTLRDFKVFLKEAHARDLRVITELVMNHTSDQHEWFQKSRRAKPGDKFRDFYVWSDTNERYLDARIIFQDFETSNWTWDPIAEAYYWHRFYHHQPDLNFDNPAVHDAMLGIIEFWLDMGVDGVRLDAVPYLYEREGTNCENLPETHAFLRKLRAHVDQKYGDRMLLAEANQWPEDAAVYFGSGDECHMNFHFPLMPRLFMAIEREDRFPIIDILEQTPPIPDNCQWGIFLRNHDELTLEMVTDEERDYMYRAYAEDPHARINLGIRRRLAPLLRDNRRKMELMNALLLSLPGTPIIYYGDEIRMGDNIYLGDRDGVRTPMQWNDDRNAGFSRTNAQRLYLPVIVDPAFHYASRNVEVEHSGPNSMLWWMRRIIALRKQHPAFGRGTVEFLSPDNTKVLAYLRQYEDETILVVANLSRFVQYVELDLSRFRGQTPIEMFGQTALPPIGELPYFVTCGPHSFYLLQFQWRGGETGSMDVELPTISVGNRWESLFEGKPLGKLEAALPTYLKRHRWFAGKARTIHRTKILDVLTIQDGEKSARSAARATTSGPPMKILLAQVEFLGSDPETYALPVIFAEGEQARNILGDRPSVGIVSVARSDGRVATLCDTIRESAFWLTMLEAISKRRSFPGLRGEVVPIQTKAFDALANGKGTPGHLSDDGAAHSTVPTAGDAVPEVTVHGGEQSNSSAVIGNRFIMKLFRRVSSGENPDLEIGRFLTQTAAIACVPQVAGGLEYVNQKKEHATLAILHQYVPSSGDAWVYTQDELGRYLERIETQIADAAITDIQPPTASLLELTEMEISHRMRDQIGHYLELAELLGRRTAEMHLALAKGNTKEFAPEPFTKLYQRSLYQSMRAQARRTMVALRKQRATLPEGAAAKADYLLQHEDQLIKRYQDLLTHSIKAQRIRCHGDYHLGQVLFTGKDFVIIDFEGEPTKSISERRIKTSPLRDVAGMIRSFHYASHAALGGNRSSLSIAGTSQQDLAGWLNAWYLWVASIYLKTYLDEAGAGSFLPTSREDIRTLLNAYLLEKAVYELNYELNNRPDWVALPLEGILQLMESPPPTNPSH